ncbi:ABC transporter ATP-binding protein [Pseudochelatococcus sp. B33]
MLNVQGLTTEYTDSKGKIVRAAKDISFEVPRGRLFTLLGPSGCGKTTTLRSIAGLERPVKGSISVEDVVVYSAGKGIFVTPNRRNFGMVFQSYAIWPHMSVFENAAFPLRVGKGGFSKKQIEEKVERVLKAVALESYAGREATRLSGGQQQRLALARALVMEPRLLLLDEPLSNLDAKLREQMRFELKRLQRELDLTTLYVTHDQQEALALSHEIAVMNDGQIVQLGTPREIYEAPRTRFVADFIGSSNFMDCSVAANGGHDAWVIDSPAGRLTVASEEALDVKDRLTVAIRPENVQLIEPDEDSRVADNLLEGRVESKVFLGECVDFMVSVGDTRLLARVHPSLRTPIGERILVHVDPAKINVITH